VVVAAGTEPAVVEHEPLDPDLGSPVGEIEQSLAVVVEVHRLPHVEGDRTLGRDRPGPGAQMAVETAGDLVEALTERPVQPGTGIRLVEPELDLARQEQLAAAQEAFAGGCPFGVVDVVAAERGVHRVHPPGGEAEPGRARVQHVRAVGAGAALAVLPQMHSRVQGGALRHALLVVAAPEVEQLDRVRGHRQGRVRPSTVYCSSPGWSPSPAPSANPCRAVVRRRSARAARCRRRR